MWSGRLYDAQRSTSQLLTPSHVDALNKSVWTKLPVARTSFHLPLTPVTSQRPFFMVESLELISICGILCLRRKEATVMGSLRFIDIQTRPTAVLDLTSLTLDEFHELVPAFEAAFQAHMTRWRLDGQPRTARQYTTYKNCPLPTPEDRLLFILAYLKTYPLQIVQGRLFGMGQSKAHQWIHVLLVVLRATLRALGDAPTRSVTELAKRLGIAEAEAAAMAEPAAESAPTSARPTTAPASAPASPLLATMGPNDASSVPRIRLSKRAVIAARKRATRSKTCC